jgi:hypothetical protein
MNDADKKLQIFFHDIVDKDLYKKNQKLSDFYDECWEIINNKSFSNINIQDVNGNTYLHNIARKCSWNWFIDLLQLGADPTIVNKKGLNAFEVCESPLAIFNFWRMTTIKELDSFISSEWANKTEKFAPNFKQLLFDGHLIGNKHCFRTIDKALAFLDKSGLNTDANKVKLIAVSQYIGIQEKINWYESRYDSPEYNTDFFTKLVKAPPVYGNKYYYNVELGKFLEKDFIQNKSFNKTIMDMIDEYRQSNNEVLCRSLIKSIIRQKFDLHEKIGHTKRSITEILQQNPVTYKLLLDESLHVNKTSKKTIKV